MNRLCCSAANRSGECRPGGRPDAERQTSRRILRDSGHHRSRQAVPAQRLGRSTVRRDGALPARWAGAAGTSVVFAVRDAGAAPGRQVRVRRRPAEPARADGLQLPGRLCAGQRAAGVDARAAGRGRGCRCAEPGTNQGFVLEIVAKLPQYKDFFPEIAQQNKKVTLMGTNTAGAGGYVLSKVERNRAGVIGYSYTSSLAFKADGYPLENLGIAPHIEYIVSPLDLQTGFLPFKNEINKTVKSILSANN